MPNSFPWRQEVFGWTSEYNYATNYNFKKSSSKCSFCYVGAVFTIIPSCFSELYFCGSTSENKVDFSFWKESFSSVCSSAHEECIFINAAKKLDKTSKAFRSISEINYINNQFSQKKHFMRKRLQSHRLHVWQSCRKKLPQNSEKFPARKKWGRKIVYWGIFFLKRFPWAFGKQKRHSC